MKRSDLLDCKFHSHRYNIPEWKRAEKCGCKSCLTHKRDIENRDRVEKGHKPGVYCKQWNQCQWCSQIKHIVKVLRHYGGVGCSKKCPVCKWPEHTQKREGERLNGYIRRLYYLRVVLGKKKYKTSRERYGVL